MNSHWWQLVSSQGKKRILINYDETWNSVIQFQNNGILTHNNVTTWIPYKTYCN